MLFKESYAVGRTLSEPGAWASLLSDSRRLWPRESGASKPT